ncbi:FxDxF family PEP-CTERM protein [Nitrosomonas sp.]|uniref:FxDxF family PEP-CTERM protein n=1 Tax=Nitrosomonas sp. TaxID=42353 RepID=UPI00374DC17C
MRNSLRLIAISVALWFGFSASIANAGIFDGQTVNYQYYFPDLSTPYAAAANGDYLVDSAVEVADVVDGHGTIDFGGDGFVISFTDSSSFSSAAFNGFVISDVSSTLSPFSSFSLVSNTGVMGTPTLSFDSDHLYVNWEGLSFTSGNLVFSVNSIADKDNVVTDTISAVPEPETYAMLLVGLGLVGYAARRKRIVH